MGTNLPIFHDLYSIQQNHLIHLYRYTFLSNLQSSNFIYFAGNGSLHAFQHSCHTEFLKYF
jgi:hypothetical protein